MSKVVDLNQYRQRKLDQEFKEIVLASLAQDEIDYPHLFETRKAYLQKKRHKQPKIGDTVQFELLKDDS